MAMMKKMEDWTHGTLESDHGFTRKSTNKISNASGVDAKADHTIPPENFN